MLPLEVLRAANVSRAQRWHPGFPEDTEWNKADWANALAGETGEACNVVKKLRRRETGHRDAKTSPDLTSEVLTYMLADELADVFLYADLLAAKCGIDLAAAVVKKFNEVSEAQGFPERLVG